MLDKTKTHELFGKIWSVFNKIRKHNDDAGWSECVARANELHNDYDGKLYEKVILAVMSEADRECKLDNSREEYKKAGKAFQDAWKMFEVFADNIDSFRENGMNTLTEYLREHEGKFACDLGNAVYEAACNETNCEGSFMSVAYPFFEEYKDGISREQEKMAYAKAEKIIRSHPEYMTHMMNMYSELKNKAIAAIA